MSELSDMSKVVMFIWGICGVVAIALNAPEVLGFSLFITLCVFLGKVLNWVFK